MISNAARAIKYLIGTQLYCFLLLSTMSKCKKKNSVSFSSFSFTKSKLNNQNIHVSVTLVEGLLLAYFFCVNCNKCIETLNITINLSNF